jgi:hypothetical protein
MSLRNLARLNGGKMMKLGKKRMLDDLATIKAISTLIIGYSNTLRGDDGVGYSMAQIVSKGQFDHGHVLPTHQLLPEQAMEIAQSKPRFGSASPLIPCTK